MRRFVVVWVIAVAGAAWMAVPASAAPGDLDPTFDGDGIAFADFGMAAQVAEAIAIRPSDGKIILAGGVEPAGGGRPVRCDLRVRRDADPEPGR